MSWKRSLWLPPIAKSQFGHYVALYSPVSTCNEKTKGVSTWRKWMWSGVCESCSSSAPVLLSWQISCSSRFMNPSAWLTAVFSRSLIICETSARLLSMEQMSSLKILSLFCAAVCADRCRTHITISCFCCSQPHSLLCFSRTEKSPSLTDCRRVLTGSETSSSPNSPCDPPQHLLAPEASSLSPGFAAGIFSVSHQSVSVGYHKNMSGTESTKCFWVFVFISEIWIIMPVSFSQYLFLSSLCCSWYSVMVFVFIHHTQHTDTLMVSTAENF